MKSRAVLQSFNRVRAGGKHLLVGDEKLYVKGVTYGPFAPDAIGNEYGTPERVEQDFAQMQGAGVNSIRTYTVPPRWLLDTAWRFGLKVMVGLPWEQHIAFLEERRRPAAILERVRAGVRACAGHPAILCFAIGNEIPASIVRWHGAARVERFLHRLYRAAKQEDPQALVTYVNFPTTEYLNLPFLDLVCFNVYLEDGERLTAYLARLQNLAGDRPLLMAEIGLDSRRNGLEKQAEVLDWQVRVAFEAGCTGAFVFAWTDEWHRGGFEIEDWDFGLTTRLREAKPSMEAVSRAFAELPFPPQTDSPRISVVVCTYNGQRTIDRCLKALERLEYPDYEVIVVQDGSTDSTAAIAKRYPVKLIHTENRGLSAARNTGMKAATGEIVAYTDDDAFPDPYWLNYLAAAFRSSDHAGIGGPNIPPPDDRGVAEWVAHAPGGPVHVLVSDTEAEHIPGCNMAFRKSCLEAIGGFDPQFRAAGDDVDICWRLQQHGCTLGFSPAAMVWHHRRNTVRGYWKQQKGYGRAEAMLERKWPEKYNATGHLAWAGRLYGIGVARFFKLRSRIYQGTWGSAPFQSIYEPAPSVIGSLPLMPEWYLAVASLGVVALLGLAWRPLLFAAPLFLITALAPLGVAVRSAFEDCFLTGDRSPSARCRLFLGSVLLHLLQPVARLSGRLGEGLTPWRRHARLELALPWTRELRLWAEQWRAPEERLTDLNRRLRASGSVVRNGAEYDRWDMEVRGGALGAVRLLMGIEEHGAGKQLMRFRCIPLWGPWCTIPVALLLGAAFSALASGALLPAAALGGLATAVVLTVLEHQGRSLGAVKHVLHAMQREEKELALALYRSGQPEPRQSIAIELVGKSGRRAAEGAAHLALEAPVGGMQWSALHSRDARAPR